MSTSARPSEGRAALPPGGVATSAGNEPARPAAVALSYQDGEAAPRVVAKGYGTLADTIIRTARDNGMYVHQSPELVGLLMQVDLDAHIPPQLYLAVAELLAWLYRLEARPDKVLPGLPALGSPSNN